MEQAARFIVVSFVIFHVLFHGLVDGRSIKNTAKSSNINKAIMKTIKGEHGRKSHLSKNFNYTNVANGDDIEYAIVQTVADTLHGAQGKLNVWKPTVGTHSEISLSQIWVKAGTENDYTYNTVEAGWMVNPELYQDNEPHFFVYWTRDGYKSTGCYNLICPGFVKTNDHFSFDQPLNPVSVYNGDQYLIDIVIIRDEGNGSWLVTLNGKIIGYWPNNIFTTLAEKADVIQWGGEIVNSHPNGHHTTTQMGSGHFPSEGYSKASYIRSLKIIDENNNVKDPSNFVSDSSNPNCYDVHIEDSKEPDYGKHFYFGGPGQSENCP